MDRRDVVMQIWSRLNPDPSAWSLPRVVNLSQYVARLVHDARAGSLRRPPEVARSRREKARWERRREARERNVEIFRKKVNDAWMRDQVQ